MILRGERAKRLSGNSTTSVQKPFRFTCRLGNIINIYVCVNIDVLFEFPNYLIEFQMVYGTNFVFNTLTSLTFTERVCFRVRTHVVGLGERLAGRDEEVGGVVHAQQPEEPGVRHVVVAHRQGQVEVVRAVAAEVVPARAGGLLLDEQHAEQEQQGRAGRQLHAGRTDGGLENKRQAVRNGHESWFKGSGLFEQAFFCNSCEISRNKTQEIISKTLECDKYR